MSSASDKYLSNSAIGGLPSRVLEFHKSINVETQMTGKVYNRFKLLVAQKEINESRNISYEEIKRATGIAASTLSAWANNTTKRFDADTIASLCEYFDCGVGELIVYERGDE